jgi:signal transduction histidine kinase
MLEWGICMTIIFEEFAESYQYPVFGFERVRITWANSCARMFLSKRQHSLTDFFDLKNIQALLDAFDRGVDWRGTVIIGDAEATADLIIYGGKGYLTIRPYEYKMGNLMNQMLSDMGQLMKDPLNNLYNAMGCLDNPQKRDNAIAVIKHSFYSLVRLSENQIAISAAPERVRLTPTPIVGFVQDTIASVNETLGDKGIVVELARELTEHICNIHPQKLTHLLMLLISNAVRGRTSVMVDIRFDDNICYIGIPISAISLYDSASYLAAAGTPKSLDYLENLTLAKIINNFNETHESRVFTVENDGDNKVIIAIKVSISGVVGEPQPIHSGLRPDLIFLSDILDKKSYM